MKFSLPLCDSDQLRRAIGPQGARGQLVPREASGGLAHALERSQVWHGWNALGTMAPGPAAPSHPIIVCAARHEASQVSEHLMGRQNDTYGPPSIAPMAGEAAPKMLTASLRLEYAIHYDCVN